MNKRTLFIIIFILAILVFGFLIYYVFFRGIIPPPTNNANLANANVVTPTNLIGNVNRVITNVNAGVNMGVTNKNLNVAIVNKVVGPDSVARGGKTLAKNVVSDNSLASTLANDGKSVIYYDPITGKFYRISPDGKTKTQLSDREFPSVENIVWAPGKDKAIISFPDNTKIFFDFNKNEQITLPDEWEDISFSPQGNQVAYKHMADNVDDRWIAMANPDGTQVQAIEPVGDKQDDVQVAWSPSDQVVAMYREGKDASSQEIYFIGKYGENFKSLVTDGRGFEGLWSAQGDKLLYNVYNADSNYNPVLHIVDAQGNNIGQNDKNLDLQTWVSKCAFSSSNTAVYCAAPQGLDEGSGLDPSQADSKADNFYKIDLNTGLRSVLAYPESESGETSFSASSVFLSSDEDYLYFTDRATGKVYKIQLK